MVNDLIDELPRLISESDTHVSQLALMIVSRLSETMPQSMDKVCLFVCLFVCASDCWCVNCSSVRLFVCVSVCLFLSLFVFHFFPHPETRKPGRTSSEEILKLEEKR